MSLSFFTNACTASHPPSNTLIAEFGKAYAEIAQWPGYMRTPLREIPELAKRFGVHRVLYKDEGVRFGGLSFKALGGAYAVAKIARNASGLRTVAAATGGNHGASVAWAAGRFGCACVLYVSDEVSSARVERLTSLGARVVRVAGGYDRAVALASREASANGWVLVSDTSIHADDAVVLDVMAGYGVIARELEAQFYEQSVTATHLFIPCGVGGLAAALVGYFETNSDRRRPFFIACEPEGAASVQLSLRSGTLRSTPTVTTDFSCLACAQPSAAAWQILERSLDAAVAISDNDIRAAHVMLRSEFSIAAGETAGAGVAAFMRAAIDDTARAALGIDENSVVVIMGTEGAIA